MTKERIDALLKPLVREASLLAPTKSKTAHAATTESKFGGIPYAEEGDSWPQCTKCNNELVFVAQLHDQNRSELFVFFYCFECFPWGLSDEQQGQWCIRRYLAPSEERLRELLPPEDQSYAVDACSVSKDRTRVLPDWEGINSHHKEVADLCVAISDSPWEEYYAAVQRQNCLDDYATLIDGYPRHVQGAAIVTCRQCKAAMRFLGQIDSEEEANLMWGDVGLVYLFQCPNHQDTFHLELQCH